MTPALSVRGLVKSFGSVAAVRGVSIEVAQGEIFGLIGPNGAGKSTTLECVLGLCQPDSGEINVLGIDAGADSERAKEKIGAQLQTSALPDAMTPMQALTLCASFYRKAARPCDLIERFSLGEKADSRYASLSGGQRQRLALALAFVSEPELVILDEPTANLDPTARRELHDLIGAQRLAGRTLIFTTHHLEEARSLCDRVALIDQGRVVALGTPEALVAQVGIAVRVEFRTETSLDPASLEGLSGVTKVSSKSGDKRAWSVESSAANRTVAALGALLEVKKGELIDLQIHRPTLDDVFMELTRKST